MPFDPSYGSFAKLVTMIQPAWAPRVAGHPTLRDCPHCHCRFGVREAASEVIACPSCVRALAEASRTTTLRVAEPPHEPEEPERDHAAYAAECDRLARRLQLNEPGLSYSQATHRVLGTHRELRKHLTGFE
jgi:hypothetical protein